MYALKILKIAWVIKHLQVQEAKQALWQESKVNIPFSEPQPTEDVKYKFLYAKPTSIKIVRGTIPWTPVKEDQVWTVDMVVTMPRVRKHLEPFEPRSNMSQSIFQDKDYLNYRYFHKRAFYLACIASGLAIAYSSSYSFRFSCYGDNPLQPMLIIYPVKSKSGANPSNQLC